MRHAWRTFVLALISLLIPIAIASADDAYFNVSIDHLTLTAGKLPTTRASNDWSGYGFQIMNRSYAVLDHPGDVYVVRDFDNRNGLAESNHLVIHTPEHKDVTGRLFVADTERNTMVEVRFKVPASDARPEARTAFYSTMGNHYEQLMNAGGPGAAWFRHRAREARKALGKTEDPNQPTRWNRAATLDDTYSLFSGNQALAENLQLEKALPAGASRSGGKEVNVDSIDGIKVAEIDWTKQIAGKNPKLDALASDIPADQHAIFFPDFASMIAAADEADRQGTPVLQVAQPRSEDAGTRLRYERQLGLSPAGLGRVIGPRVINSIAITGSDPYLRAGSDIAILFEPRDADALKTALTAQIAVVRKLHVDAAEINGDSGGVHYTGARNATRSLCTYLAVLKDGAVVVTNSPAQLARLAAVQDGKTPALAKSPDYLFFRDRYKLGDADESALIVLSDATIRRWCGARWRIADSRRTRAAAVLADLDAKHLDKLVGGKVENTLIDGEFPVPDLGELHLTSRGATSSTYGSLDFLTPISELKFNSASEGEAEAYKRWRDTYESNWRGVFDPIAIRFGVREKKLSADVTVMPLIWSSDYRPLVEIATGAAIDPARSDPHDTLFRAGLAININAAQIRAASAFALQMAPNVKVDPLGWVGQSIWLYADDDPFWTELAKAKEPDDFMRHNYHRAPVALQIEVSNGLKLAAFLVALHGFVDQSAPGMTLWENVTYNDQTYVRIAPSAQARGQNQGLKDVALYYRATGMSLLLSMSEPLIRRAIDRDLARAAGKPAAPAKEIASAAQPLLGTSLVLQADAKLYDLFERGSREGFQRFMQQRSWSNLPILNEWKHRYPQQDPAKIYERFFNAKLVDPAGGQYAWNETWQTFESSVYGSPAEPKKGPDGIATLAGLLRVNLGVTFENNGLRARGEVERSNAK